MAKEVVSKQTTVTVLRQVVVEHVVVDRLSYRILYTYYNVGIGERIGFRRIEATVRESWLEWHQPKAHQRESIVITISANTGCDTAASRGAATENRRSE